MVVVDLHPILDTKTCIRTGELRVWGDVGENGKDEFVWELENCENGVGWVNILSREPMEEVVPRLVWGAGDRRMTGRCFPTRPCASLAKNVGVSRWW